VPKLTRVAVARRSIWQASYGETHSRVAHVDLHFVLRAVLAEVSLYKHWGAVTGEDARRRYYFTKNSRKLAQRNLATPGSRARASSRRAKEPAAICEAAFASLQAPLRPVRVPADPMDDSEGREASGR
jgi:hypothetical protein